MRCSGKARDTCLVSVFAADPSINLDPRVHTSVIAHLPELADLLHLVLDKLLTTKPRVYYRHTCHMLHPLTKV